MSGKDAMKAAQRIVWMIGVAAAAGGCGDDDGSAPSASGAGGSLTAGAAGVGGSSGAAGQGGGNGGSAGNEVPAFTGGCPDGNACPDTLPSNGDSCSPNGTCCNYQSGPTTVSCLCAEGELTCGAQTCACP